jgi:hypothetical protein
MIRQYGVEGMDNRNEQRNESTRFPEESYRQHQDFDDSANDLWSLYGKEAKSHDEARIDTLKDDMDGVLIFVCAEFPCQPGLTSPINSGRLILWCSHRVRGSKDSGFESKPRRPVGLLPESIRSDA